MHSFIQEFSGEHALQMLQQLASWRSPLLNKYFLIWNFVDTIDFVFIALPLIWLSINRKKSYELLFLICCSAMVNTLAKGYFQAPRPIVLDPHLPLAHIHGYSFPSGAAQTATFLLYWMLRNFRTSYAGFTGVIIATHLYFSRLYLAVHYPFDIFGGIIAGMATIVLFRYCYRPARYFYLQLNAPHKSQLLLTLIGICLIFYANYPHISHALPFAAGALAGVIGRDQWQKPLRARRLLELKHSQSVEKLADDSYPAERSMAKSDHLTDKIRINTPPFLSLRPLLSVWIFSCLIIFEFKGLDFKPLIPSTVSLGVKLFVIGLWITFIQEGVADALLHHSKHEVSPEGSLTEGSLKELS